MVRFILRTFKRFFVPYDATNQQLPSSTTPAENTDHELQDHITTRFFLVLTFWIFVLGTVALLTFLFGPQLWKSIGDSVIQNYHP